jgi:nitronate monooxygenase
MQGRGFTLDYALDRFIGANIQPARYGFTGRLARGIKNRLLDDLNQKDIEILPYPLQRALVRHLSIPAEKAGRPDLLPLWAGQSANLSRCTDVRSLLDTLVKEISEIGDAVQSWSAHRQLDNEHG